MTSTRPAASPSATAKLWFWLVISTAPVAQVAHRVVAAVVAEGQLVGARRRGAEAEELVAEADAEDRHLAEQRADGVDGVGDGRGVAGAVGEEDAVGLAGQHLGRRRADAGTTSTVAMPAEVAQDRGLDAEVVGHDPRAGRRRPVKYGVGAWCTCGDQVDAVGAGLGRRRPPCSVGLVGRCRTRRAWRRRRGGGG